jgi:hypothetical protein
VQVAGAESVATAPSPRFWTELGAHRRGFSGTGVYRHDFELTESDARRASSIEFDSVGDIARVLLNGRDCGIAWTPPYRVDISSAVLPGGNSLEIHVATPWRNRLIAEAAASTGEIFAPMTEVYEPTATPLPAGLQGPVFLRFAP